MRSFKYFLGAILLLTASCEKRAFPELQNIVVILSDDHALNVTGTYGNEIIRTPNIDRIADEGITFDRSYCNAPICSASRQSMLTGKYPHATGVNLLFTPFPDEQNTTIAEHLQGQGYETAIIGKTHWNNWVWYNLYKEGLPTHGFDTVIGGAQYNKFLKENPPLPLPGKMDYYARKDIEAGSVAELMNYKVLPHPIDDAHSKGTFYANEAVQFMKSNSDNPFLVWLAFHEPHQPYYFPIEYRDKYDPEMMPLPEGSPEDDRWIPAKFRNMTDEQKRGIIASYYTSTEYMDKNIGIVLDAIDEMGLAENTVVIYLSDNGYLLYEHKRFEKHTMWEEATHQPMIVKAGKRYRAGEREDAIIEYIDVVPTLLEMVGAEPLKEAQGESFVEVIINESEEHKTFAFSEYLTDNLAMITSDKWKYVFHTGSRDLGIDYATGYGPSGIVHRLYNLENDPKEYMDVSKRPENKEIRTQMQNAMLQRFIETHPDAKNCPEGLTLEGKLVWFCEPRDVGDDQGPDDVPKRVFTSE